MIEVRRSKGNVVVETRGHSDHLSEFRAVPMTQRVAKVHFHVRRLARILSLLPSIPAPVALLIGAALVAGAALRAALRRR